MRLRRNILSNAGATAIGSLIQLMLILGVARWLSVPDFAAFITAVAVVGFGEMASDFGVRIWGTRQFAVATKLDGILGAILLPKLTFSSLLVLLISILPIQLLSNEQALLAALIACTQPSTDPLLWFMRGRERLDVEALVTLCWRVANALMIGALAWGGYTTTAVLSAWLMSNIVRCFVEWNLPLLKSLRIAPLIQKNKTGEQFMHVIRQALPIGSAFLIMAAYQRLGVLLLGAVATSITVAHFGAAFTLVASAGFVATSITVASFPRMARAAEIGNWEQVCFIANQKLQLVAMFFFPSCLLGMFLAPWLITLIYPAEYAESAVAMVALLPGLYISSINFALKYVMNTLHRNWMDVASVVAGILIFVVVVLGAARSDMLKMAGIAWGLGEAAIFIVKAVVVKRDARMSDISLLYHLPLFLLLELIMLIIIGDAGG